MHSVSAHSQVLNGKSGSEVIVALEVISKSKNDCLV